MSAQEWEPGVPLYPHPGERDYGDGNYVRHLFDLVADEHNAVNNLLHGVATEAVCAHCLVGWPASEGPDCWECGKRAVNYDEALEREQTLRELNKDTAVLIGGPADGYRHHVEHNDPYDPDHAYVDACEGSIRPWLIYRLSDRPDGDWVRHRYERTDEWDNARAGYRFRYEGEVTDA